MWLEIQLCAYSKLRRISSGLIQLCKGLSDASLINRGAYIRGGLYPRGLISEAACIRGGLISEEAYNWNGKTVP